jgi:dihydroorotate dehydrogenase
MKLRGIDFGHVFNASGARGFRREGYWFHHLARPLGLNYKGSTFVAKTTTLMPREGNMKLGPSHRPIDFFPDCIVVKMRAGVVLNSVGLSGPGCLALVEEWKKHTPPSPFIVSIMSVQQTPGLRLVESKSMIKLLQPLVEMYGGQMGLQINFSCPNVGLEHSHLIEEVEGTLNESKQLGIPTMIKLNALVDPEAALHMAEHAECDAVVVSNTIPWGQLPDRIDWKGLFGSDTSPIAKYGGGGLSGKPLLPIVCDWIRKARSVGMTKPIVGGGGILSKNDAGCMLDAGATAVELGSVAVLRPWRVQGIIRHVNDRLGDT